MFVKFEADMHGFLFGGPTVDIQKIGGPSKLPKDFPWPIPNHSSPPKQLLYDRSLTKYKKISLTIILCGLLKYNMMGVANFEYLLN